MAEKIGKLIVAVAGAGKTFTMAHEILKRLNEVEENKNIYAITFTNSATQNILKEIRESIGYIPPNVIVTTTHSFLLSQIIYPFSRFVLDEVYNECSVSNLPDNISWKQGTIKRYKEQQVIHAEIVTKKSQMIFCDKKSNSKKILRKKEIIRTHFYATLDSIYIDEAQDMDNDFFNLLHQIRIDRKYLYIVGDPNQAIKKVGTYSDFIEEHSEVFNLEVNTLTRRSPSEHLELSNFFVEENYRQSSLSKKTGKLYYIFESDEGFNEIFDALKGLKYIKQKTENFITSKNHSDTAEFTSSFKRMIEKLDGDNEARKYQITQKIILLKKKYSDKYILKWLIEKFQLGTLSNKEYAIMLSNIRDTSVVEEKSIMSINKVKGLGNEFCSFVLDNSMYRRLISKKFCKDKENNLLYVALTRSKETLLFIVSMQIEEKYSKSEIINSLEELGVKLFMSQL